MDQPATTGPERPCTCTDRNIENGAVFDLLMRGMTGTDAVTGEHKPIPPWTTRDGRIVYMRATFVGEWSLQGQLVARDGNRFTITAPDGAFTTFNADNALFVTVFYMHPDDDPEAP